MGPPGAGEWEAEGSTWAALEAAGNGVHLNTHSPFFAFFYLPGEL